MPDPDAWPTSGPCPRAERPSGRRRAPRTFEVLESRVLLSFGPLDGHAGPPPGMHAAPLFADTPRIEPRGGDPREFAAAPLARMDWQVVEVREHGPGGDFRIDPSSDDRPPLRFNLDPSAIPPGHDLPFAVHQEITGEILSGQDFAIYKVPARSDTAGFDFEIHTPESASAAPPPASHFVMWREDGSVMGQYPLSRPGDDLSIRLSAVGGDRSVSGPLYLGIVRDTAMNDSVAAPASAPTIAFTLTIDRQDRSQAGQDASGSGRSGMAAGVLAPSRWTTAPGSGLDGPSAEGEGSPNDPTIPPGLGQDAIGLLPLRSSGPNGGDGEAAPQEGPLEGAIVDLALLDLSPDAQATSIALAFEGPVAAIASPDGFPLLGSARPPALTGDDGGIEMASATGPPAREELPIEADPDTGRPTFAVGLGILVVVTAGLVVPDVVATFAPKVMRRPLPWEGRSRRRRWRAFFGPDGALGV